MAKVSKKDRRRLMIWSLLLLVVGSYLSVFVYNYWSKILANYDLKDNLEKQYQSLLANEKELSSEVTKLQDPNYVAKFAREKYMYSKEGEIIIRITE